GVDGTVEEVGFRSTRVRTFANSLVSVPNGRISDMTVDNFGLRRYRRFSTTIAITYDTPPDMIEAYVKGLREIIAQHPKTWKGFYEVQLNGMGSHSLDILFYTFFDVLTWSEEIKARHELLISIIKLAETLRIRFAFPTQTLHMEEFPEKKSLTPKYEESPDEINKRVAAFLKENEKLRKADDK
ncbi:MAG: mechanosensitive ion channel domain-containing protein, partial [Chitinophagales bacterium]